jgi:hypothetical protein
MKLVEYVPDYILRNYLKVGQVVTILHGSKVNVRVTHTPTDMVWEYDMPCNAPKVITNFLPGYTEVYKPVVHNHQVVWVEKVGEALQYHSTDINNVKEIQDAP